MLNIKKLIVGEMATNCYLVYSTQNRKALIVDPGDEADYVENIIRDLKITPEKIILTHGHSDHISAAEELALAYGIDIYMSYKDQFLLNHLPESFLKPVLYKNIDTVKKFIVGGNSLKVQKTPGHTPGSVCLYSKSGHFILSGDILFGNGLTGEYHHPYSNKEVLKKSVDWLMCLPKNVTVYAGHEDEYQIVDIKKVIL